MSLTPYEPSVDWWKQYYTGKKTFTIRGKGSHLTSDPNQDLARVISTLAMKKGLKGGGRSQIVQTRISSRTSNTSPVQVTKKNSKTQSKQQPPPKKNIKG